MWFDQNELRGGDAWDASIRKKIKECALFVPVISANTESRSEGYFRLEWKLAVDRSHLMADDQPFLLPVVIDDIPMPRPGSRTGFASGNGHVFREARRRRLSQSTRDGFWATARRAWPPRLDQPTRSLLRCRPS